MKTIASSRPRHPRAPVPRRERYLHLFALTCLAVAQPLLDVLRRDAEFFVVRGSGAVEIVILVVALVVVPPLPLVTAVALASRRSPRLGAVAHGLAVGALATLLALRASTHLGLLDGRAWLVTALALGAAAAWAYGRFAPPRLLVTYLGVALVVVPAAFFLDARVARILAGREAADLHVSGGRAPVVFLVFDELSLTALLDADRRIDAVSYPHLAALAREATWFTNAATVSDVTELALPALLTGRFPRRRQLPALADHPRNLFTALGGDYRIWAVEPVTRLCPPAINTAAGGARAPVHDFAALVSDLRVVYLHLLLPPRYAGSLPVISDRWRDFGRLADPPRSGDGDFLAAAVGALRRDRREDLRRLLAELDPEEPRALYFLHVLLPHTPWEYLPSGKVYATETDHVPGLERDVWREEEAHVVQAYRRYLLQVQFLDRWLGALVARLRQLELYDRALIVLTADHGVSFRPGDSRRLLSATNYSDLVPVPLLIKAPGQRRGGIVERPVSTVDVLPTVLDLLDVEPRWTFDGGSVFEPGHARRRASQRVVGKYRDLAVGARLHRDKYATLDWKLETFGSGPALFRAGTHPELYGRGIDEIGWREQDREQNEVTLRFSGESLFQRPAADDGLSPASIRGVLATRRADPRCCDLAVAVNGTIYATVRTFGAAPDDLRFAALVPDAAFGGGSNRVDVFRVRRGGPDPVLERLGSSGATPYALVTDAAGRATGVRRGAREWPLRPGALRGYFTTEPRPRELRVAGWAVDVEAGAAPEQVLAFYREELVSSGLTTRVRPDVSAELDLPGTVRTAFELDVPRDRVPEAGRFGLRLFALSPEAASELGFFYQLERDAKGLVERIRMTNGRDVPVDATLTGFVEELRAAEDGFHVRGWAVDLARREPAERILVFVGDTAVYDGREFVERGDVAAVYDVPEVLETGFEYDVALASNEPVTPERLLVFAVSATGKATRLPALAPAAPTGGRAQRGRAK